jgi:hypothetical protein
MIILYTYVDIISNVSKIRRDNLDTYLNEEGLNIISYWAGIEESESSATQPYDYI